MSSCLFRSTSVVNKLIPLLCNCKGDIATRHFAMVVAKRIPINFTPALVNVYPIRHCSNAKYNIAKYDEIKDLPNHPEKLLIDVREYKELEDMGKIPTSINIPLGVVKCELGPDYDANTFRAKYWRDKPSPSTELIFHCMAGIRSGKAAEVAIALGYKNVKSYKGSWNDWVQQSHNKIVKIAKYDEVKDLPRHPEKLLIDVREYQELADTGIIPTSINIPIGMISHELSPEYDANKFLTRYGRKKPNAKTEIIFTCKLGIRAGFAAETALAFGYENVKNYKGSWTEWAKIEKL